MATKADKEKLAEFFKKVGEKITKFRKEKNLSLEALGSLIGQDGPSMHRTEKGKPFTGTTIIKLSLALNKHPRDFFDVDFNMESDNLNGLIADRKSPKKKAPAKKKAIKKKEETKGKRK